MGRPSAYQRTFRLDMIKQGFFDSDRRERVLFCSVTIERHLIVATTLCVPRCLFTLAFIFILPICQGPFPTNHKISMYNVEEIPIDTCYAVKCDKCGKTTWAVRPSLISYFA